MPEARRVGQIAELPALPEARTWHPTEEQFKDFYGYIRHIQPEAHKSVAPPRARPVPRAPATHPAPRPGAPSRAPPGGAGTASR